MVHEPEVEAGSVGLPHRPIHLHRHGGGEARPGWAQAEFGGMARTGTIGEHQTLGAQGVAPRQAHQPDSILLADRFGIAGATQFGASHLGLAAEEGVENPAAHDPEGGIAREFGPHWILQGPGEANAADHLIHGRREVKGEPALHRCGHAAATGVGQARPLLLLQQDHPATGSGDLEGGGSAGGPGANDDGIRRGWGAQTLRISASFSARCFSNSLMKRSVSF